MSAVERQRPVQWAAAVLSFCCAIAVAQGAAVAAVPAPAAAQTPASAPTEDIRDIRGPRPLGAEWPLALEIVLGTGLAAAALYAAWRWRRKSRSAPTPAEVALGRLDASRPLIAQGACREFAIEVSDAVREYVQQHFGIEAWPRTTEEFLRDQLLSEDGRLASYRGLIEDSLGQCDLAKFSGWRMTSDAMATLHGAARRFVVETAGAATETRPVARSAPRKETYVQLPTT